jgi:hypothetical protein
MSFMPIFAEVLPKQCQDRTWTVRSQRCISCCGTTKAARSVLQEHTLARVLAEAITLSHTRQKLDCTQPEHALGKELQGQGRMAGQLEEIIAVHGLAEAIPLGHKAAIGHSPRHGNVIEEVPARQGHMLFRNFEMLYQCMTRVASKRVGPAYQNGYWARQPLTAGWCLLVVNRAAVASYDTPDKSTCSPSQTVV